jgi:hypothetical protein
VKKNNKKIREEAMRMFLTGECDTNAEIALKLHVKPHTVGRWRKEEDWDSLRLKIDRRAAEMFVEKIASDRVTLNVRHYRMWELLLAKLADNLKSQQVTDIRELERVAGILERSQKGQRLAKGLSMTGETEEAIRAQSHAAIGRVIDTVIDAVKEHVTDEETRDSIRRHLLSAVPEEESVGAGDSRNALSQ